MEKDKRLSGNVIPFPKLEERLLEKGKRLIEKGDAQQALPLLLQAEQMNESNPETMTLLAAAYGQIGNYRDAKEALERLLRIGSGDYFYTMEIYISILFQLNEYERIGELITMLFEEHQIPFHKIDQYKELLDLCNKMKKHTLIDDQRDATELFSGNFSEIIQRMTSMTEKQLFDHLDEIQSFLEQEDRNPFIKTVVFNQLSVQRIDKPVLVKKYGLEVTVNPASYFPIKEVPFITDVKKWIEKQYSFENPVFMEYALTLADRFFFNVYPLEKQFSNPIVWSKAIATVVNMYMDGSLELDGRLDESNAEFINAVRLILTAEETFEPEV
ncbi:tetratricopeptide repeat protein [Fervidibacillus albus]|uniref:Tetratricopeptide repeat protein n=1 Tax=Fervidibacillus albus TaxID=2980026 RepID=A0A9E8LV18_9BACI|nr:tetratricopeptide repeat protein [Fervidibacillus albus]WAA10225.1 tetratricopeptide repeat protein [Fervidibacillus albus]